MGHSIIVASDAGVAAQEAAVPQQAGLTREQAQQLREQAQQIRQQAIQQAREAAQEARDAAALVRAQAQAQATLQGTPTIAVPPPRQYNPDDIPPGAVQLGITFFITCAIIAIGLPITRAWSRRMDRRSVGAPTTAPEITSRLERIEQAVDAIALEVERISEAQRFTTKLMTEARALPAPDPLAQRDVAAVERGVREKEAAR